MFRLVRALMFGWVVVMFLAGCNRPARRDPARATAGGGTTEEQLETGGATRLYRLHVPPGYTAGTPMPLVLNLHGLGQSPAQQETYSGLSAKADAAGFIVVYPQGNGEDYIWYDWPGSADLQFLRDLIEHLSAAYTLDPARIYVTGLSNGGGMANRLACAAADVIAAIGPVSGAYNLWDDCQPSRPIPVVAFHGTGDIVVPYEGMGEGNLAPPIRDWAAAWAERNGCDAVPVTTAQVGTVTGETWSQCDAGADVVLYTIDGGGHTWPGADLLPNQPAPDIIATDVIWDFFLAHPKP